MANSIGDWFKRYWVRITLVFLALAAFVLYLLLSLVKKGDKNGTLRDVEEGVRELKEQKAEELKDIDEKLKANAQELKDIKSISDEEERLNRLAAFANRRKGGV